MSEDILRDLEEAKKQSEKAYIKLKGMIEGIRLGKLGQLDKLFLGTLETMFEGFNRIENQMFTSFEMHLQTIQRFNNLEPKVSELEKDILQLRQTLDEMVQNK